MKHPRWTPEQDAYLARWWGRVPASKVAGSLRRSVVGCQVRASKLGIKSDRATATLAAGQQYKGDAFYLQILSEHARLTVGQMALKHDVPLNRMRAWIDRARRYRDAGKFRRTVVNNH